VRLSRLDSENPMGNANMQTAASKSLFLKAFSSFSHLVEPESQIRHAGLYQLIAQILISAFHSSQTLAYLTARLALVADHAHSFNQFDIVEGIGQLLLDLPFCSRQSEGAGRYYKALGVNRRGSGDPGRAVSLFEEVADRASLPYRAKATLALGTTRSRAGEHQDAVSLYREVLLMATRGRVFDPVTSYHAVRNTAIIRSVEGDRRGALADLEKMVPLARMAGSLQPYVYYDYMNTLAVELGEAARLEQARRASQIALASPYARLYPEWHETLDEINSKTRRASRSTVGVSQLPSEERDSPTKILSWSADHVRQANSAPRRAIRSASVISLQDWKNKLEKKSTGNMRKKPTAEEIRSMDFTEKQATITRFVYADEVSEQMLDSILEVTSTPNADDRDGS
jgi:hypothetical protein